MAVVRRLILKGIGGTGARAQAVLELERPARLTAEDMRRALDAAAGALGAKVRVRRDVGAAAEALSATTEERDDA